MNPGNPLLCFLHGFPLNSGMWKNQLDLGLETFCPDLLGSKRNPASFFTLDMMAEDVLQKCKSKKRPLILCGLSMGGYIAQRILELSGESVQGLILISTRSAADTNTAKEKRTRAIQSIRKDGLDVFLQNFSRELLSENNKNRDSHFEEVLRIAREQSMEGILSQILALQGRIDMEDRLESINIPTLIITGIDDKLSPPDEMRKIFSKIPNHEFHVIIEAGHLSPIENSRDLNKLIQNFIQSI